MPGANELKRLTNDLQNSEELRNKLDEAVKRNLEEGKAASDGEVMVLAAAELGYEITVADLERASAEAQDLDDAELEGVGGGYNGLLNLREDEHGHDEWCLTAWHCYIATLHTESKQRFVSCWSDFSCSGIYHNS